MLKINHLKSNAQNQYKQSDGLGVCFWVKVWQSLTVFLKSKCGKQLLMILSDKINHLIGNTAYHRQSR